MTTNKPAEIKRQYIPLKCQTLSELHGITTQMTVTLHSHKSFKWDTDLKSLPKCLKMINNWRRKIIN
jgi:hypothetical protein